MAFVIWLGTPIVFDIAEEVPPPFPPAPAGSLLALFLSILWDKI